MDAERWGMQAMTSARVKRRDEIKTFPGITCQSARTRCRATLERPLRHTVDTEQAVNDDDREKNVFLVIVDWHFPIPQALSVRRGPVKNAQKRKRWWRSRLRDPAPSQPMGGKSELWPAS